MSNQFLLILSAYATQGKLIGTSIMLILPGLMTAFAVMLKPVFCKWLNITLALTYIVITSLVIQGAWYFYVLFGVVEILIFLSIIWHAWKWPRADA